MSIFGRMIAGSGAGAAQIAGKYIDEEISNNRAKFLSDLEQQSFEKRDQYQNSDAVVGRNRANKVADETAVGAARNTVELAGKRAQAMDTELTQAEAGRSAFLKKAEATALRETTKDAGADTEFLAAQGKIKLADPEVAERIDASRASASSAYASATESGARTEGIRLNNADKKTLDALYAKASTIVSDPKLTDEQRGQEFGKVQQQIGLMKSKGAPAGTADPTRDTVKITEEEMLPGGGSRKTERTEVRRGGQPAAKVPEADAHAQARAAIKAGANAEAVNKMLADKGYRALPAENKQNAAPAPARQPRAPAASYEPPADSLAGKYQAKAGREAATRQQQDAAQRQDAALAFDALDPRDKAAAARMQSGPMFGLLNRQQQQEIYNRVNGR